MTPRYFPLGPPWRVLIADLGLRPGDVLRRAELPEDLLSRPDARLASDAFFRFWESLEQCTGSAHFALRFNETLSAEAFFPPIFAALCSPNFRIAAQRIGHYKALIAPMRVDIREARGRFTLTPQWLEATRPPPGSLVLSELFFTVGLVRAGTREAVVPVEVGLTELPDDLQAYAAAFGITPQRADAPRISFATEDAERPFLTADDAMWAAFEPELRRRLAVLESAATTRERVSAVLLEGLPSGVFDMAEVARKLAMSKRTLQRRLAAEDCSYTAILDSTRCELALHYLRTTHFGATDIAFLLGFGETTSFYRAFSRWTGRTPEAVRRESGLEPAR